ncbi:MAG: hypothetical protein RLZZ157_1070, partial [Pseudomonadota bacterium]
MDIAERFGLAKWQRAIKIYLHDHVTGFTFVEKAPDTVVLTAEVHGSAQKPYETRVQISGARSGALAIASYCTCPVGNMCKHAAAVAMEWLDEMGEVEANGPIPPANDPLADQIEAIEPAALTEDVARWLSKLSEEDERARAPKKVRAATPAKFVAYVITQLYNDDWVVLAQRGIGVKGSSRVGFGYINARFFEDDTGPSYIEDCDLEIARRWPDVLSNGFLPGQDLHGNDCEELLAHILATGRAYLAGHTARPLKQGPTKIGRFIWQETSSRHHANALQLTLALNGKPVETIIKLKQWYWVDTKKSEIGLIDLPVDTKRAALLLDSPPIPPKSIDLVGEAIPAAFASQIAPLPVKRAVARIEVPPIPVLELKMLTVSAEEHMLSPMSSPNMRRSYRQIKHTLPVARVWFDYGIHRFGNGDGGEDRIVPGADEILRIVRDTAAEARHLKALEPAGLTPLRQFHGVRVDAESGACLSRPLHFPPTHFFAD